MRPWIAFIGLLPATGAVQAESTHLPDRNEYRAPLAVEAMTIDGKADEAAWARAEWHAIDHRWLGPEYTGQDFQGRFKDPGPPVPARRVR